MKTSAMMPSKYLKQSDFPEPQMLTISKVEMTNVAPQGQPRKARGVMFFERVEKGLVLNKGNLTRAEKALGSDETDDWVGKQIVVYVDPDVEFAGEIVGGIKLRAPRPRPGNGAGSHAAGSPATTPRPAQPAPPGYSFKDDGGIAGMSEDIPF